MFNIQNFDDLYECVWEGSCVSMKFELYSKHVRSAFDEYIVYGHASQCLNR